jgi:hypothetical protein
MSTGESALGQIILLLSGFPKTWFVCGGWAIDLHLRHITRPHKDIDIGLFRRDQVAIHKYLKTRGWQLEKAVKGSLLPWHEDEFIQLPIHTIWCKHPTYEPSFLELLLNETDGNHFLFRRDLSILRDLSMAIRTSEQGIPYLSPEVVLLYKAGAPDEPDNEKDFQQVLPSLFLEERSWLKQGLERLYGEHKWLSEI